MEMLGFERKTLVEDGKEDEFLVLNTDRFDLRDFTMMTNIMNDVLTRNNMSPLTQNMQQTSEETK